MTQLANKIILVTGGGSGIGKIMSRLLLERKAKVVIWDIDQNNINETINAFSEKGIIKGFTVDVSDSEAVKTIAQQTKEQFGQIDVIINNAGVVVGKYFHEQSSQEMAKTVDINSKAPMFVTQAFLKEMIERNSGHICNISSSGSLVSNPKMSVYAASKWFLTGWSDSLRLEMKQLKKDIKITTIMPYFINTHMFKGVKSKIPILEPEAAALTIIKAIEQNKRMLSLPGYIYRVTRLGQALFSINFFDWFTGQLMGVYKTMEYFKGKNA